MTSSWTYPQASPGLWFNTTEASQDGVVLVGGSFQFDTTANFGFYVLNQAGQVLQSDVWEGAYVKSVAMSIDGTKFTAAISGTNGIYYFDRGTFTQGGSAQWQYVQPGISKSSCAGISSDDTFAIGGSDDGYLYGFSARGNWGNAI